MNTVEDPTVTAIDLLLSEYKGQPLYEALIGADAALAKNLYDLLVDVRLKILSIADAEGEGLDRIGKIVGEPRWTTDDDEYRLTLRAAVLVNRSNGTLPQLLKILRLLADIENEPGAYVEIRETGTARIYVEIVRGDMIAPDQILRRARRAKAAGVAMTLVVTATDSLDLNPVLRFGWTGGSVPGMSEDDEAQLGWTDDSFGGLLSHVVT
jgi:hypothetical protein